jgi:hypothetical protein
MKLRISTLCILAPIALGACSEEGCEPNETQTSISIAVQIAQPRDNLMLMLSPAKPVWGNFDDLYPMPGKPLAVVPANQEEVVLQLESYDGPVFESQDGMAVFFLLSTFQDLNSDGSHQVGEPIDGLSDTVLAYFETVGCGDWRGFYVPGWNAIEPRSPDPAPASLEDLLVGSELQLEHELVLNLQMNPNEKDRVAIAPESMWEGKPNLSALVDKSSSETLQISLPEVIPEDHLQGKDVAGETYSDWYFGVHWPLLIEDLNASGHFDADDSIRSAFCISGTEFPAKIGHYPEADTLEDALFFKRSKRQPGWGLYKELDGEWRLSDPTDLESLSPGTCPLP